MSEWTDGRLLNDKAIDNLTLEQLRLLAKILENVK